MKTGAAYLVIFCICLLVLEISFRIFDGYFVFEIPLNRKEIETVTVHKLNNVREIAQKLNLDEREFEANPEPTPEKDTRVELDKITDPLIRVSRTLAKQQRRIWNKNYVEKAIESELIFYTGYAKDFPVLHIFEPNGSSTYPRYRLFPNDPRSEATDHNTAGLVTNNVGYRGQDIDPVASPHTIRLAFLGASTTISSPYLKFAYPDYLSAFLNQWAQKENLNVVFETINTAREGQRSEDMRAVASQELALYRPDIVIYMEGANHQFGALKNHMKTSAVSMTRAEHAKLIKDRADERNAKSDDGLHKYSALLRRVQRINVGNVFDGIHFVEDPRPSYSLDLPDKQTVERNIEDGNYAQLPLGFNQILADLDAIDKTVQSWGGRLYVSSFVRLAYPGMKLPKSYTYSQNIHYYLNGHPTTWPLSYQDNQIVNDLQNAIFKKYSNSNNLSFVDIATHYPQDYEMFIDSIHKNDMGLKLHAWILYGLLKPDLQRLISSRNWLSRRPRNDGATKMDTSWASTYRTVSMATFRDRMSGVPTNIRLAPLTKWKLSKNVTRIATEDGVELEGPAEKYWYLAVSPPISVDPDYNFRFTLTCRSQRGHLSINVLDVARDKFIKAFPVREGQACPDEMNFRSGSARQVRIIVTNADSEGTTNKRAGTKIMISEP